MYEVVFDEMLGGFQVAGEELSDTVTRVLTQMDTVISGFQALDIALDYTALQIAAIADGMVIAAGSIENLQAVMTSYYDTVYTDAEKAEIAYNLANDAVRAFNVELGLSGEKAIDTVEELKAYVEALDVSTAAGQAAMVTAMALAESIGTLSGTAQEAVDSISDLVEEIIEVTTEADSFTTAIQSLAEQLYGTAEDAYALELERYAALKAGAESLLDTARGFSDSATSDSTTLSAAQVEYNNQLQAVQGGDVSAIADLQSAATSLKSALDDSYAGGSQATSGTLQIESQLRNLAESLDLQAIEPTAPEAAIEATLTEADRALLADALLTSMQELALAEDKTVADLMAQNGVYITSLADDLGLNLDSLRDVTKELSDSEYSQLESIAERVGLSTLELSKELGVNASSIGASIADNLASLPNVPDDIKSGLAPYLSAIENSNDYATMESNLNALSNYADSLPADIKSQLNGRLIAIRNAGVGTTQGISSLKNMTQSELTNVADSFGVNSESITAAVSGSGDAMLSGLSNMATAYNSNSLDVAESLDINANVVSGAIADSLSSLPNVPDDIKDGLAPYLSAIESSNNYDDLETNLDVLAAYASALPADIKSQLNGRLIAIRNAGVSTVQGLSQLRTLTSKELNAVADGFGVNAQSIEDAVNGSGDNLLGGLADMASAYNSDSLVIAEELGLNASTVAGAISQNLSDLPLLSDDIKNGLAPYLAAIESSNNYDDLERSLNSASAYIESLPADIKDQLKARLESIRNAGVSTVQGINALNNTTAKELSAVASSFGVNSRSIESAVNGSGTELLNGLSAMARAYGAESTKIAEALGINASVVGQAISNNLQALPNLSNDIKGGLSSLFISYRK